MTKEHYMALADFQNLWTNTIKPQIPTIAGAAGKADKVSGSGLNNHLAALDADGNLKDSGKSIDDIKAFATTSVCESIISELT